MASRQSASQTRTFEAPRWSDEGEQVEQTEPGGGGRGRAGPPWWAWLVVLLVAALAGVGVGAALAMAPSSGAGGGTAAAAGGPSPRHSSSPSPNASGSAGRIAVRHASSFDPSGGSGITRENGVWQTEHYASAEFGNLKPGIGLVLDLGSAKKARSVRLKVISDGLGLRLYARDSPPSSAADLGQPVGHASHAAGTTTLRDSASGRHRYLVIWVDRLAPSNGRYRAAFTDVTVRG